MLNYSQNNGHISGHSKCDFPDEDKSYGQMLAYWKELDSIVHLYFVLEGVAETPTDLYLMFNFRNISSNIYA